MEPKKETKIEESNSREHTWSLLTIEQFFKVPENEKDERNYQTNN